MFRSIAIRILCALHPIPAPIAIAIYTAESEDRNAL